MKKKVTTKTKLKEGDILIVINNPNAFVGLTHIGQLVKVISVYTQPKMTSPGASRVIRVNVNKYAWTIENFIPTFSLLIGKEKELYKLLYD